MLNGRINRRRFMSLLGGAGACVAMGAGSAAARMGGGMGMGMGGMGMMGGMGAGPTIIDPAPGELLRMMPELKNISAQPGIVRVLLESTITRVNVNGQNADLHTYNGMFPGPLLRVKRGDVLRLSFKDSLPVTNALTLIGHERDHTNLHTHGFHVSPAGFADNVMIELHPGETFNHEYDLKHQYPGCMAFYHPHVHGSVAEQYWGGQAGPIIVEDPTQALSGYATQVLLLKDLALWGDQPASHNHMDYMHGKEGDIVMVNGQVNPRVTVHPGEVQRWRIVNASNARYYNLSLEGHQLNVIGTDSGLLDKPYPVNRILLVPGERIDLLVQAGANPGNYKLLALPYNRGGHCCSGSGAQTVTLMTMTSEGNAVKADIPPVIDREAKRVSVDTGRLPRRQMALSMGMGKGFINNRTFGDNTYTIDSKLGTWEIWEVYNQSMMDHPFHYHVNCAQVLSITGGDPDYATLYTTAPAFKDTVNIPKFGSAVLLMQVADWPGMSMMHCHIIEHEDIGMMGAWNIA